ncbi:unnamed protein product [Amoebophrya sp. A25]|nr:unnamed protein product [Amoebophrya sp. A25]|eukprot:GSA25T00024403001.1
MKLPSVVGCLPQPGSGSSARNYLALLAQQSFPSSPSQPSTFPRSNASVVRGGQKQHSSCCSPSFSRLNGSCSTPVVTSHHHNKLLQLGGDHMVMSGFSCFLEQRRGYYFRRANWFPTRRRRVYAWRRQLKASRNLKPRYVDYERNQKQVENSTAADYLYIFRKREVRVSLKRLVWECGRPIMHRNLQDGIDFLESLARPYTDPVVECLRNARDNLVNIHKKDPARLVIQRFQSLRGRYVKSLRFHSKAKIGIVRSPRNHIKVGIREMTLEEFFQKAYVIGKVPTTLTTDMRLALYEGRVGPEMHRQWSPYITSTSRWLHRRRLKYLEMTKQLDLYRLREAWAERYEGNLRRKSVEARRAREII